MSGTARSARARGKICVAIVGMGCASVGWLATEHGSRSVAAGAEVGVLLIGRDRPVQLCRWAISATPVPCRVAAPSTVIALDGAIGDLDGDGDPEAVLVTDYGDVFACAQGADGAPVCAALDTDYSIHDARAVALGDLDGDDSLDVVFARWREAPLVCHGDGSLGFVCAQLGNGDFFGRDVALGDFDGDGDQDIALAGYRPDRAGAEVCLNHGDSDFGCRALAPSTVVVAAVRLVDADGDGRLDALLSLDQRRGHVLCAGDGMGSFACLPIDLGPDDLPGSAAEVAVLHDAAGGPPDLLVAGWPTRRCHRIAASEPSTLRFACRSDAFDGQGSRALAVADLDGDGDEDVVLGGPNRVCLRADTAAFTCHALGDPEAHALTVALGSLTPLVPGPTLTPGAPTPRPTLPAPTPWPIASPTTVPAEPAIGAPATDAVILKTRGAIRLPAFIRALRIGGTQGVAFGGVCDPAPRYTCRAAAILLDLTDPDQPRQRGTYVPDRPEETIVDAAPSGPTLYLVTERRTGADLAPVRRHLVAIDASDPAHPRAVSELDLGPPVGQRYPEPEHGGLVRLGEQLVWGTSAGLRVYDITRPYSPKLTARLALPASALGGLGDRLFIAEPEQTVRILHMAEPAHPRDLGNVFVHAGGHALVGLPGLHVVNDRACVTLRLQCAFPGWPTPPFPGGAWFACGSGLAEVALTGPAGAPARTWSGLINHQHGLGAVRAVGDLLLVAQGRLVVLDARRADRPVLGELPLAIDVAGTMVPAHPYDIAIVDGRAAVLVRADDTQPAELRVLEVQRQYRLFLPNAAVARR